MGFYKSKWFNKHNLNKPKFYLRYVDSILAAFNKEQDLLDILKFLNIKQPKIYDTNTSWLTCFPLCIHFRY